MSRKPLVKSHFAFYKEVVFIACNYRDSKLIVKFSKDKAKVKRCQAFIDKIDKTREMMDPVYRMIINGIFENNRHYEMSKSHYYRLRRLAVSSFLEIFDAL